MTEIQTEARACPGCRNAPQHLWEERDGIERHRYACYPCIVAGPWADTDEQAIAAWNAEPVDRMDVERVSTHAMLVLQRARDALLAAQVVSSEEFQLDLDTDGEALAIRSACALLKDWSQLGSIAQRAQVRQQLVLERIAAVDV